MPTSTSALPGTTILNLPIGLVLDGTEQIPGVQGGTTKRFDSMLMISGGLSSAAPLPVPSGGTGTTSFDPYRLIAGGTTSSGPLQQVSTGVPGSLLTYVSTSALTAWSTTILAPSSTPNLGAQLIATSTSLNGATAWKPPLVVDVSLYPTVQAAADVAMTAQGSILWFSSNHALSTGTVGLNLNGATYLRLSGGGNLSYTGSGTGISLDGTFQIEIDHLRFLTEAPNSIIRLSSGGQNSKTYIHECYFNSSVVSSATIGIDAPGSQDLVVFNNYFSIFGGIGIRLTLDDGSLYSVNPLIDKNNFNNVTEYWVYSPSDITTIRKNTGQITPGGAVLNSTGGRPAQALIFEENWIGDYTSTTGGANIVISNALATYSRGNFYANSSGAVSLTQVSCTGVLISDSDSFSGDTGIAIGVGNALGLRGRNQTNNPTTLITGTPSYTIDVDTIYGRQNIYGVQSFSSYGSTGAMPTGVFTAINRSTAPLNAPTVAGLVTTTVGLQMAAESQSMGIGIDVYGTAVSPNIITRTARGTQASPQPLQTNDTLFNLVGAGYGSTNAAYLSTGWSPFGVLLTGIALENWSTGGQGSAWDFYNTSCGAVNVTNKMRLGRGLMVGTTSDPGLGNIRANGTFFSANPVTLTGASGTVTNVQGTVVFNTSVAFTVTLPLSSLNPGCWLNVKNIAALAINSASTNILPLTSTTATVSVLTGFAGAWATLQSDGAGFWVKVAGSS